MKLFSLENSIKSGEVSLLAIIETVALAGSLVWLVSTLESGLVVFFGAAILPLGLLQTPQSQLLLRRLWAKLDSWVRQKANAFVKMQRPVELDGQEIDVWDVDADEAIAQIAGGELKPSDDWSKALVVAYQLPLSVVIWAFCLVLLPLLAAGFVATQLVLAVFALGLFIVATVLSCIRNPIASVKSIPSNFARVCWCTDSLSEPKIIPESVDDRFVLTRLIRPRNPLRKGNLYNDGPFPKWLYGRKVLLAYERIFSFFMFLTTTPFLYAIAIASRMSVKSSLIMYGTLSLLWEKHVDARHLEQSFRATTELSLNKMRFAHSVFVVLAFILKLLMLLKLNSVVQMHSLLGYQLDWLIVPKSLPLWQITGPLNAILFLSTYLYAESFLITSKSYAQNPEVIAGATSAIRFICGGLSVYTSFCLVVLFAHQFDMLLDFRIEPYFPDFF